MSIKIIGADDLAKELSRKARNINQAKIKECLNLAGGHLEEIATTKVPVDTSNLKKSIKGQLKGLSYEVEASANYAGYVEYGTRFMEAQPYMEPAYRSAKTKFQNELKRMIKE